MAAIDALRALRNARTRRVLGWLLLTGTLGCATAASQEVGTAPALCQGPDSLGLLVEFLDVGQGDAVLFTTSDGRRALVDGGPADGHLDRLLAARGVSAVDLLVLSHNHEDHIGGIPVWLRRGSTANAIENGHPATTKIYREVVGALANGHARLLEPTDRELTLGSARIRILPPLQGADDQNNASVGAVIRFGKFATLLTGDAERPAIRAWLAAGRIPAVTVAKVGHHGSRNASTKALVDAAAPPLAVISLSADNNYGHPHHEAIALWSSPERRVLRTDEHGTVTVRGCRDGTYDVRTER